MPNSASLPLTTLYTFLVVLARVTGALVFAPIPGFSAGPEPAKIIMSLALTVALAPLWPTIAIVPSMGLLVGWLLSEAALGITIGLVVSFLSETMAMFGQIVGLQAGYSFASTVDPNSQADSGIFIVLSQAIGGLLFFALGLHREVLRAFAASMQSQPPGAFAVTKMTADAIIRLGSTTFSTGLRLSLPIVALLIMVDLALALLGRINSQLQLLTLAFPAKMLGTLALLIAIAALFPRVYSEYAGHLFRAIPELLGR